MGMKEIELGLNKYLNNKGIESEITKNILEGLKEDVTDALEEKKTELDKEIKEIKPDYGTSCFKIKKSNEKKPIVEF